MSKTTAAPQPATPPQSTRLALQATVLPERESKNYDVFTVLDAAATGGKSPILIGNDGRVYIHKALKAAGRPVTLTVTLD